MAKNKRTRRQRNTIPDKLMLLGNIVFSAMVIAPLATGQFGGRHALVVLGGGLLFTAPILSPSTLCKEVICLDRISRRTPHQWHRRYCVDRLWGEAFLDKS